MAIIVTQTADNAYHIQDAFRRLGRDTYPMGVYEAIFEHIHDVCAEDEAHELDPIAWCGDITKIRLQDNPDFEATEALAAHLQDYTTVLHYDGEAVWYMAF